MARTRMKDFLGIIVLSFVTVGVLLGLWPLHRPSNRVKRLTLKILPIAIVIII